MVNDKLKNKVLEHLNTLREQGTLPEQRVPFSMEHIPPYIKDKFNVSIEDARMLRQAWVETLVKTSSGEIVNSKVKT